MSRVLGAHHRYDDRSVTSARIGRLILKLAVPVICAFPLAVTAAGAAVGGTVTGTASPAVMCTACHGTQGEGNVGAAFPRLAGLGRSYLERQLEAFANGQRKSAVMEPIAQRLKAPDRSAMASYYARLPYRTPIVPASPAPAASVQLATMGRWDSVIVPACVQCHGPDGAGVGDAFPPLAGQPAAYIAQQLASWQQGTRPPGPLGLMHAIAARLTPADIAGVAHYFGGTAAGDATARKKP